MSTTTKIGKVFEQAEQISSPINTARKEFKLLALCALAFTICWRIGVWFDEQLKKIKLKTHAYKANSFFRKGLNLIRDALGLTTHIDTYLAVIKDTLAHNR
jgi:hypothetical protein